MSDLRTKYKVNLQGMIVEEITEKINEFDNNELNERKMHEPIEDRIYYETWMKLPFFA